MELLTFHLDKVNWVAVIVAVLASFAVGSIWYAPPVFGKYWMKASGLKEKDLKNASMIKTFGLTTILNIVMVTGLATLMCALAFKTWQQGAVFGALVSAVFIATSRGVHMLFENKGGVGLFLVNAGYDVAFLTIAGAIIGAF